MDTTQQDNISLSSPAQSLASSSALTISPSSYLTVPNPRSLRSPLSLPRRIAFEEDDSKVHITSDLSPASEPLPQILVLSRSNTPTGSSTSTSPRSRSKILSDRLYMSVHSTSSTDTDTSEYSNPPARPYRIPSFQRMSGSRKISAAEKQQYIRALQTHQINTLIELRRVEKAFAVLGTPDCSEPMTSAWSYYVDSHGLLTELRGLTRNYPFSSDCLDEAKRRVYSDPASNCSWNLCWLVLSKIQNDKLIPYYARYQASLPAMWAGHTPSSEQITQLTNAFVAEWNYAISQMLRHWDQPPTR